MVSTHGEYVASRCLRSSLPAVLVLVCALAWAAPYAAAQDAAAQETALKPPLSVLWTFSMGPDPRNLLAPVVDGDRVFVSHGGKLYCLDLQTGAKQWDFALKAEKKDEPTPQIVTAPVLVGDKVIVGANDAKLYAVSREDGKKVWETRCSKTIVPNPALFGDLLVLAAGEMVYGIEAETGTPKWVCSLAVPAAWGPVVYGGSVYFLSQDGSIQAVDPRGGRFRWRSGAAGGPRAFPPVAAGGRILVASGDMLRAVARTGATSWQVELPSPIGAAPTVVEGTLYVPCVDGSLFVLSARSGWDKRRGPIKISEPATSPPLVDGGKLMVGTATAMVYVADIESGDTDWIYRCIGPDQLLDEGAEFGIYAPLVKADGMVLCMTGDGDLYCFSSSALDPVPPRFSDFKPEPNDTISSEQRIKLSFVVTDDGSGVVADSVKLMVDGKPTRVGFNPVTGVAKADLAPLDDGVHLIQVSARDYRGNEGMDEWSFLTDESIPPVEETEQTGLRSNTRSRTGNRTTTGLGGRTRTRTR